MQLARLRATLLFPLRDFALLGLYFFLQAATALARFAALLAAVLLDDPVVLTTCGAETVWPLEVRPDDEPPGGGGGAVTVKTVRAGVPNTLVPDEVFCVATRTVSPGATAGTVIGTLKAR